jgi:hypothetical protein
LLLARIATDAKAGDGRKVDHYDAVDTSRHEGVEVVSDVMSRAHGISAENSSGFICFVAKAITSSVTRSGS